MRSTSDNRVFATTILAMVLLLACGGCGKQKSDLLSQTDMEEVLFTYHKVDGIVKAQNLDSLTAQAYYDAVLTKHGITKAMFDSSMTYYMSHADMLFDIYTHLSTRFDNEARLQGIDASRPMDDAIAGDTANIWRGQRSRMFTTYPPGNFMTFHIPADTSFHPGDRLTLSFNTDFRYQDGSRNGYAVMAVKLSNDSVVTRQTSLTISGRNTLDMRDDKRLGIKEIRGFIMHRVANNSSERQFTTLRLMKISDIMLTRMHTLPPQPADSLGESGASSRQ